MSRQTDWLVPTSLRIKSGNKDLFFANVICCSRLQLWVGSFTYFKFSRMFFYLMFKLDVLLQLKKWIGKAMCVLLFDVLMDFLIQLKK